MKLQDLRSYKKLKTLDENLSSQIESIYNLTKDTINSISASYSNFTMHDIGHSLRVAKYMEEIAFGIDDKFDPLVHSN